MSFYTLTHIDGDPLPVRLTVNAIDFLVTEGSLELEPPNEITTLSGGDGMLNWEMRGYRLPESRVDRVTSARHLYRRLDSGRIEFPVGHPDVPTEYFVDTEGATLVMSSRSDVDRELSAARLFGGDRTWQFAIGENPGPRRGQDAGEVIAIGVMYRDREVPWLSRLISRALMPILHWKAARRSRRASRLAHRSGHARISILRIRDTEEMRACGIAGLVGPCFGECQPSASGNPVCGPCPGDYAVNVWVKERNEGYWVAPEFVEVIRVDESSEYRLGIE